MTKQPTEQAQRPSKKGGENLRKNSVAMTRKKVVAATIHARKIVVVGLINRLFEVCTSSVPALSLTRT